MKPRTNFQLWFDGVKVLEWFDIATTINKYKVCKFRIGLCASDWHDDSRIKGTRGIRQVKYDKIVQGTTFVDKDGDGDQDQ